MNQVLQVGGFTFYPDGNCKYTGVSIMSELENIEVILAPDATITMDKTLNRKAVVKRCEEDQHDLEKAVCYALLKMHGITPKQIQKLIDNASDYREPKGKKHEKKNSND